MTRALLIALTLSLFTACSHHIQLIGAADGTTITGTHDVWHRTITVTLPSGIRLEGPYQPLTTGSIGEGSLFFGANVAELLGRPMSGRMHGYARLTGSERTVLEMVFALEWIGRGYGVARVSTGEEYRVMF
ncbi:MAG: hypothetical protein EPO61_14535 [Nitrospirae bacterium]|nr:MAG: hypothetical protein EPO61_14535 [Nitrospirota bacterium]